MHLAIYCLFSVYSGFGPKATYDKEMQFRIVHTSGAQFQAMVMSIFSLTQVIFCNQQMRIHRVHSH